jgi:hypothetical protein
VAFGWKEAVAEIAGYLGNDPIPSNSGELE